MDRLVLTAACVGLIAGLGGSCAFYNPEVVDCSVRCGEQDACPTGLKCREGFCRPPNVDSRCDCRPGETRACGGGKGECNPGVQNCNSDGTWSACLGETKPREERCDGKDNNCDGVVDNGVGDPPVCEKSVGECAQARQVCVDGGFQACSIADYGPFYEAVERSCDNRDNDCDGFTDSTPPLELARGLTGVRWDFLGYDAGFAAVYGTSTGVEVRRFDGTLTRQDTVTVLPNENPQQLAAVNLDSDVFVVWGLDGGLSGARVRGTTVEPLPLLSLQGSRVGSDVKVGVNQGELVAGFRASGSQLALLAKWPFDGGTPGLQAINVVSDGGISSSFSELNVSRGGHYAYLRGTQALVDGGTSSFYLTFNTTPTGGTLQAFNTSSIGSFGTMLEDATRLVNVYAYSYSSIIFIFDSYSGVYFKTNLLVNNEEATVRYVAKQARAVSTAHGILVNGRAYVVFLDELSKRIVLASEGRIGISSVFRSRNADTGQTFGAAQLAGVSDYLGLAWEQNGVLYGQRTCAP